MPDSLPLSRSSSALSVPPLRGNPTRCPAAPSRRASRAPMRDQPRNLRRSPPRLTDRHFEFDPTTSAPPYPRPQEAEVGSGDLDQTDRRRTQIDPKLLDPALVSGQRLLLQQVDEVL